MDYRGKIIEMLEKADLKKIKIIYFFVKALTEEKEEEEG